ncbi:hypothetical protein LDENG_00073280 [Lucifuga dentata]|nr:hypothetical protein LDENG_00073280 [Lucifuga dentata]
MFRGPLILTWSSLRPLLLGVRDLHLPACSAHTGAGGCHDDGASKERRDEGISGGVEGLSLSKETIPYSPVPSLLALDYNDFWIRAFQAAPCEENTLRDCLCLENEERCRHSLSPNLKLYKADEGRRGAGQSEGKGKGRWASVLVSLCSVEREPAFLFTLRSSTLKGRHKGDVSFPGGKSDPSDIDVVATALREAQEELGLNVATERVWGILKPLRDKSGMIIAPVLANLGPLEALSFKPNPAEVEEIFTMSLSHLCNPLNRGYTHFRAGDKYGYTFPVFRNGKYRVWGLTAVALDQTLKLIVPR